MTYEDAVKIPERQRTAAQQKIVAEWEWAHPHTAEAQPVQVPVQVFANASNQPVLFAAYERFLAALAHIECAAGPYDPKVAQHDDYVTFIQFVAMPAKDRDELIHFTNLYFQNHPDLSWTV
jgi:hypothetical protein